MEAESQCFPVGIPTAELDSLGSHWPVLLDVRCLIRCCEDALCPLEAINVSGFAQSHLHFPLVNANLAAQEHSKRIPRETFCRYSLFG